MPSGFLNLLGNDKWISITQKKIQLYIVQPFLQWHWKTSNKILMAPPCVQWKLRVFISTKGYLISQLKKWRWQWTWTNLHSSINWLKAFIQNAMSLNSQMPLNNQRNECNLPFSCFFELPFHRFAILLIIPLCWKIKWFNKKLFGFYFSKWCIIHALDFY